MHVGASISCGRKSWRVSAGCNIVVQWQCGASPHPATWLLCFRWSRGREHSPSTPQPGHNNQECLLPLQNTSASSITASTISIALSLTPFMQLKYESSLLGPPASILSLHDTEACLTWCPAEDLHRLHLPRGVAPAVRRLVQLQRCPAKGTSTSSAADRTAVVSSGSHLVVIVQ